MHSVDVQELMRVHARLGVPVVHTVALVARLRHVSLSALAREAGYHRNSLYQALVGDIRPPQRLHDVVIQKLGIDPWRESA